MIRDQVTHRAQIARSTFNALNIAVPLAQPEPNDVTTASAKDETRFALLLGIFGGLLLVAHLFYNFVVPLTPGRMARPASSLISELPLWSWIASLPLAVPRTGETLALSVLVFGGVISAAYALAVYTSWNRAPSATSLVVALLGALLFFLIATVALPNVNTDIFNYIMRGRVGAVYDSNLYYVPVDQFPADPIYQYADHRYTRSGTGKLPAWELLDVLLARLANDAAVTNLFVYRSTFLLFNMANVALIAAILRKLNPRSLVTGIIFYAWNPIVGVYGQSKTDTIMVFCLLAAILLLLVGRKRFAVVALALSALVKLITLPLVALYWLREARLRRWRTLAVDTGLLALTAAAVYAPFWRGFDLPLKHLGEIANGTEGFPLPLRLLGVAGFALIMLWLAFIQDGSDQKLIHGWAVITLLFSVALATLGLSWYLMTLIAIVSLAVDWRLALATVALTSAAFVMNSWDNAGARVFQLPDLFDLPRLMVYLSFLGLVALATIAFVLTRLAARRA